MIPLVDRLTGQNGNGGLSLTVRHSRGGVPGAGVCRPGGREGSSNRWGLFKITSNAYFLSLAFVVFTFHNFFSVAANLRKIVDEPQANKNVTFKLVSVSDSWFFVTGTCDQRSHC